MESNWRLNVWNLGFTLGPFQYYARILSGTWAGFYLAKETLGFDRWFVIAPQVFLSGSYSPVVFDGPYSGAFPFGFELEPD